MSTSLPTPSSVEVARGVEQGIEWVTCEAPLWSAVNGYAFLPPGHPWRTKSTQDLDYVDVHGGITFGPSPDGWVGFDTMHAGDYWEGSDGPHFCGEDESMCTCIRWTAAMVATEAANLATQIAVAVQTPPPRTNPPTLARAEDAIALVLSQATVSKSEMTGVKTALRGFMGQAWAEGYAAGARRLDASVPDQPYVEPSP